LLHLDWAIRRHLAADESLKNTGNALTLSHLPLPFGIFNIKLMKCGGILNALEIAAIARNAAIELFWGCNDESIVSITAALHAAFACESTRYLDLDGSFDLAEDIVTGGFTVEDGYMRPNGKAGLGVTKLRK
jgi:L-alanine-DL-glutamate epimerase-like enolase superfamily enzyme